MAWFGFDSREFRDWLVSYQSLTPLVFVIAAVGLMSICLPKTIMSITAGALFGTGLGSVLLLTAAVTAAVINYVIGRWLSGSTSSKSTMHQLQQSQSDRTATRQIVDTISKLAEEAGFRFHLLVRLSPIPTMVISYAMGFYHARFFPYVAAAAVAVIPQVLWIHSGTIAGLSQSDTPVLTQWVSPIIATLAAVLVSVLIPREVMKKLRSEQLVQVS